MNMNVHTCIAFLEQTNDPAIAFFSFDTDADGERGIIRANKEGLRLYALELLKKSLEIEHNTPARSLSFDNYPWLVSDTGYDLIAAVQPECGSRQEIMDDMNMADDTLSAMQTGI